MINTDFLNNEGGAWYMNEARGFWSIDTCQFIDNLNIDAAGGGVRLNDIEETADVMFENCTFLNNHAPQGGGLYSEGSLGLSGTTFSQNWAAHGGACRFNGSDEACVLTSVEFLDNVATEHGGAVFTTGYILGADLRFIDNRAENGRAGAMLVREVLGELAGCWFEGNEAQRSGALEISCGTITNTVFVNNRAEQDIAAVNCGTDVVLRGCTLAGNLVSQPSGGDLRRSGMMRSSRRKVSTPGWSWTGPS